MRMAIIECVPNISEGRRPEVVRAIVGRVAATPGVHLLDWSSDASHNRSVITLAGDAAPLEAAVLTLFERGIERIDLRQHQGEHPRMGAVDVVPFVPDRGRHDGGVRAAGAETRRGGRRAVQRARVPLRGGGVHARRGATSRTSAAASSRAWPRRWRSRSGHPDFGPAAPHPSGRRVGHRRAHAAHRLQHQPRHRPPRRRQEDRHGDPA